MGDVEHRRSELSYRWNSRKYRRRTDDHCWAERPRQSRGGRSAPRDGGRGESEADSKSDRRGRNGIAGRLFWRRPPRSTAGRAKRRRRVAPPHSRSTESSRSARANRRTRGAGTQVKDLETLSPVWPRSCSAERAVSSSASRCEAGPLKQRHHGWIVAEWIERGAGVDLRDGRVFIEALLDPPQYLVSVAQARIPDRQEHGGHSRAARQLNEESSSHPAASRRGLDLGANPFGLGR